MRPQSQAGGPQTNGYKMALSTQAAADMRRAHGSRVGDAFPHVDAAPVQQRDRFGSQHHHAVVPLAQLVQQSCFGWDESRAAALMHERIEQDAIFDGGLTVADPPEGIVVERCKDIDSSG